MPDAQSDAKLTQILAEARTIALVGASPKENRPSFRVMAYLQNAGYRVLPINPGQAGKQILGEDVYGALSDIDTPIDIVDIFRRAEFTADIVTQAVQIKAKAVWMQLGISNDAAAAIAIAAGIDVVMDRCTKIEHARLMR